MTILAAALLAISAASFFFLFHDVLRSVARTNMLLELVLPDEVALLKRLKQHSGMVLLDDLGLDRPVAQKALANLQHIAGLIETRSEASGSSTYPLPRIYCRINPKKRRFV